MTSTAVSPTDQALSLLSEGSLVSFTDLLRTVAKADTTAVARQADLPVPVRLSDPQRAAFERLPELLDAQEAVCPTERRKLTPGEVVALLDEREMLDAVAEVIEARKSAHRAAIFNAMDVALEETVLDAAERPDQDDKGHYLHKTTLEVPDRPKCFSRELRTSSPSLSADDLLALVEDPDVDFTHDDYLSCTTQVRVLDEAKFMLHLRKRPAIVAGVRKATKPGSTTASCFVRKRK